MDSKDSSDIGNAVLTYGTAPARLRICTKAPSAGNGLLVYRLYPTLESNPLTLTVSFRETGIPASGPERLISSSSHASASGTKISVKQFVFSCAFMATFVNAFRISIGRSSFDCTVETNLLSGSLMIRDS